MRSLLLSALLLAALPAAAQTPQPDYAPYSAASFIPFSNAGQNPDLANGLQLGFAIGKASFTVTMDTGSTGVVLSAGSVPGYAPETAAKAPLGWEFLSSSKRLWVGRWIQQDLQFVDAAGKAVVATVPVLAVEKEYICPGYVASNQAECPNPKSTTEAPKGIAYMGVGFGREHDGQPQGTPDKNPLLNVTRIDGTAVAPGAMRPGYIVTARGVHVGLTRANTAGFAFTQITGAKWSKDARDWPQAGMCVQVNDSPCVEGTVLADTGIPQMYLSVTSQVPLKTVKGASVSDKDLTENLLAEGSKVTIRFPNAQAPVASYSFTVGDGRNPMQPTQVIAYADKQTAFVNTGRMFYRRFEALFDAEAGLYGLKWIGPANAPEGGMAASAN